MFSSGFLDPTDYVGAIRRERLVHLVLLFGTLGGLSLFAMCGMGTPIRTDVNEIQDTWMWYRYMLVITTILPAVLTEVYLLFTYNWLYLLQWVGHAYSIGVIGFAWVADLIILVDCTVPAGGQPKYPQCADERLTFVIRFCVLCALMGMRMYSWWNTSNLRNTVDSIGRMRRDLRKASKVDSGVSTDTGMAELYSQIRNEQVLHVISMILIAVSWGFFATATMWLQLNQVWLNWIFWRNSATLLILLPLGWTQLYFLLGGTLSRAFAKWGNFIWLIVLSVHAIYFAYIYDNCNQLHTLSVTLVHPECGTPALLDDSVISPFYWRVASFVALFGSFFLQLVTYQSVTHSLMTLATLKKQQKTQLTASIEEGANDDDDQGQAFEGKRIGYDMNDTLDDVDTRKDDLKKYKVYIHNDSIGSTLSVAHRDASINAHMDVVLNEAPAMQLFCTEMKKNK
jgi:hypothetical protein